MKTTDGRVKWMSSLIYKLSSQKLRFLFFGIFIIVLFEISDFFFKEISDHAQRHQINENTKCLLNFLLVNTSIKTNRTQMDQIVLSLKDVPRDEAPEIPKTFLLEEKNYCSKLPNMKAIAYVHSAIEATEKRKETRETWGTALPTIGTVFMVGRAKSKKEEEIVHKESQLYGDIVQGNYTDTYELLLYKALNSLYWVTKHCSNIPWVLHSDDDTIIDPYELMPLLNRLQSEGRNNEIFCHNFRDALVRRKNYKWIVSRDDYPCDFFPTYCAGPCWFTSMKAVQKMLSVVPDVRFLWVDDVYITGIVAERSHILRSDVPIKLYSFSFGEIGSKIAWVNANASRSELWQYIKMYHENNNNSPMIKFSF